MQGNWLCSDPPLHSVGSDDAVCVTYSLTLTTYHHVAHTLLGTLGARPHRKVPPERIDPTRPLLRVTSEKNF